MELTEGEFSCFSLEGRLMLTEEFGTPLLQKQTGDILITVYELYGFYVEIIYDKTNKRIIKAERVTKTMLNFYNGNL